jgi:hypothetical protein
MADHDKYLTGSGVSRYLRPGERSWGGVVYRSGSPVLDSELILENDISTTLSQVLGRETSPSGWLKGQSPRNYRDEDYGTPSPGHPAFVAEAFYLAKQTAIVNGWPIVVEYSNTNVDDFNIIPLEAAPIIGGAPPDVKRTDFVFLEVWQTVISDSTNASGTITLNLNAQATDSFDIAGFTLTGVVGAPAVDEFTVGASPVLSAANIAAAINNPANSFFGLATAQAAGAIVTVRAVASGTAGNATAFSLISEVAGGTFTFFPGGGFLAGGVDESGKPTQDSIYRHGNVLSSAAVALPDDIADPVIGTETSKRLQIQYRIRTTGAAEAVNFKTQADGFNAAVLAQGSTGAPVAGYPFVPADKATVLASSDATAYDIEDAGLWISGDGSSTAAAALGTVDGFVYAIPVCFVFRRNDASASTGFTPLTNTNGGLSYAHGGFVNPAVGTIPAGESDRPDGFFYDAIEETDILDLRRHVALMGHDMASELDFQMKSLLDGNYNTWAIDAADKQTLGSGSGDVSTQFLVCNQVGRASASGGVPPLSGDTSRGDTVRNFDHVSRRFGDSAIVEQIVLAIVPSDDQISFPGKYVTRAGYAAAYTGWAEDDEINIDLTTLNATTDGDFDPNFISPAQPGATVPGGNVATYWPPGATITDIGLVEHDDGHFVTAVPRALQTKIVTGFGTEHLKITLDRNDDLVNGGNNANLTHRMVGDSGGDDGSARRIFIELEITYPLGSGLTDTPDFELSPDTGAYPEGAILENDTTQRPTDWEAILPPKFREGKREVVLEYVANEPGSGVGSSTPITDNFVSMDLTNIRTLRRIYGSGALLVGVTDVPAAAGVAVDTLTTEYGGAGRRLITSASLSGAGQTEVTVTYFGQDALPNFGAPGGGYQVGVYYRSNAPQTVGVMAGALTTMEDPLTVKPLLMAKGVWSGTVGSGSADLPFPYAAPLDQIAMNDGGTASFPGEWYFAATAQISIDDFNAGTGILNLHAVIPADGTGDLSFNTTAKDAEFRSFYRLADPGSYRPTAFAQNLSNPARHKVFMPFLARATVDTVLYRKGEVLLVVLSRFAELDDENTIRFLDTDNRTAAAIYRTRGLLLVAK